MRGLHCGHVLGLLALHMQQDYVAVIGAQRFEIKLFVKEYTMAAIVTSQPAPLGAITTYRAVNALSNVFGLLGSWNDARITRKALGKLSDRELDDIGLCRGDIEMLGR